MFLLRHYIPRGMRVVSLCFTPIRRCVRAHPFQFLSFYRPSNSIVPNSWSGLCGIPPSYARPIVPLFPCTYPGGPLTIYDTAPLFTSVCSTWTNTDRFIDLLMLWYIDMPTGILVFFNPSFLISNYSVAFASSASAWILSISSLQSSSLLIIIKLLYDTWDSLSQGDYERWLTARR